MTETNHAPVEPPIQGSAEGSAELKDVVSYETHRKLLAEAKAEREARRKLEAELAEVRKRDKAIE